MYTPVEIQSPFGILARNSMVPNEKSNEFSVVNIADAIGLMMSSDWIADLRKPILY